MKHIISKGERQMGSIAFSEEQKRKLGYYNAPPKIIFNEDTIRSIFGHEAAEDEDIDRLKEYYLKTDIYMQMRSKLQLLILVGHKGVGKSALLRVLSADDIMDNIIPITILPNEILNLDISDSNFLKRIEIWKNGISEIIFSKLVNALNNQLGSKFKNESVKAWIQNFSNLTLSMFGKKLSELQKSKIKLSSSQFVQLFQNALFSEQNITIYLDDLDRGWENTDNDIKNLSAMLNAVRDLSRSTNSLRFRIALRSDVYYAVRTSDETTDKIDGSVIWQSWTNHEILVMLIKRIETYFGRVVDEEYLLSHKQNGICSPLEEIFEKKFYGSGHWANAPIYRVIMSLIRKRPRDLVKLCTLAARQAYSRKHNLVMTSDLEKIFPNYSNDRLTDTSTEYKSEFPKINELLLKMKPSKKELLSGTPCLYTRSALLKKLSDIISMSNFSFKDGKSISPNNLAAFLYKINFLTARKDSDSGIQRIYYDENQYIYNEFADFGYSYEIHPAYRWALQPNDLLGLYSQIVLN